MKQHFPQYNSSFGISFVRVFHIANFYSVVERKEEEANDAIHKKISIENVADKVNKFQSRVKQTEQSKHIVKAFFILLSFCGSVACTNLFI